MELAVCVSLLGSATSLAVVASSGNRPRRHMGEEAGSCDSKASFFSTKKYTVIAMNRVRFANTQFLNEMCTYIGDCVSS